VSFGAALALLMVGIPARRANWRTYVVRYPDVILLIWQSGFSSPWHPTPEDLLANDWQVAE